MNFAILSFIIGFILQFEALFLLLPWIVGMIYGEYHVALIYLATAVVCFILGKLLSFRHTGRFKELYVREGFTAVALGWFVMSVFGAIPFVLTGDHLHQRLKNSDKFFTQRNLTQRVLCLRSINHNLRMWFIRIHNINALDGTPHEGQRL